MVTFLSIFYFSIVSILACIAGILVYQGLSTTGERQQLRLRFLYQLQEHKNKLLSPTKSLTDQQLKLAGNPLGLNASRYFLMLTILYSVLFIYYGLIPLISGQAPNAILLSSIGISLASLLPTMPFSLFNLFIKRVIEYKQSKLGIELFTLYDMLINEVESNKTHQVNTYNFIKSHIKYFDYLRPNLTILLSNWTSIGPEEALKEFQQSINTPAGKSLSTVLRTLDDSDRTQALEALKSHKETFVTEHKENFRRQKRISREVLNVPIIATHYAISLNFVIVIFIMVLDILTSSRL
ncbi:hypothetical protein [Bacillus altitudinis]|uniref:hypothetical protein n=1 Tax=Bacillus altitudinis TaxID=293387 RepID=UPI002F925D23